MKFIRADQHHTEPVAAFISRAGTSLETFRYFDKRPLGTLAQHLCTWLIAETDGPVAYGHLDQEDGVVWLGIAVIASAKGKSYGKRMMERLVASGRALGVKHIRLSVDNVNTSAIQLYAQFGFQLTERRETFSFFQLDLTQLREAVISSLAFPGESAEAMIAKAEAHNLLLEFSSGLPFRPDMEAVFLQAPVRRFAHNYFPAPEVPFVLNLASSDATIRQTSVAHCIRGIQLSAAVEAPFFSAHAGFCIDPRPEELGQQLRQVQGFDREKHWALFLESVREVLAATADLPTGFLIENNVLADMNLYSDGSNPLLCVDAAEHQRLLHEISDPRLGLLLDTAHLKVSARTLGFDAVVAAQELLPRVRCVHHSDNDGLRDTNQHFTAAYWFLPLLPIAAHAVHVLEVRKATVAELQVMNRLLFS